LQYHFANVFRQTGNHARTRLIGTSFETVFATLQFEQRRYFLERGGDTKFV
jgi:hypothetical protein